MRAAIDVGSNTIRMLLGVCHEGKITPHRYHREIVRLAGNFSPQFGLAEAAIHRAISTLKSYQKIITSQNISQVRVVGTAALRRAENRQFFVDSVFSATGLEVEIISGAEEALLTSRGVLSVVCPVPESIIIIDIGGGSTELVCLIDGQIRFQQSYPLGVVRLCEECSSDTARQHLIDTVFKQFREAHAAIGLADNHYELIGTAGTVTTLAAIHLQLEEYDAKIINNHKISVSWLEVLHQKLKLISVSERETLVGMESGRGDLILPGMQILLTLTRQLQIADITVADSGLLEGVMLGLTDSW